MTARMFFTSDTHFGHGRLIELGMRRFADVTSMDEAIVAAWNERVQPEDTVWHLGDFSSYQDGRLDSIWWRLNGMKHLVPGNHDDENPAILDLPWESVILQGTVDVGTEQVFVNHYAMRTWPGITKGVVHLYGHAHGRMPGTSLSVDVGTDVWGFRPVLLEEARRAMSRQHPAEEVLTNEHALRGFGEPSRGYVQRDRL